MNETTLKKDSAFINWHSLSGICGEADFYRSHRRISRGLVWVAAGKLWIIQLWLAGSRVGMEGIEKPIAYMPIRPTQINACAIVYRIIDSVAGMIEKEVEAIIKNSKTRDGKNKLQAWNEYLGESEQKPVKKQYSKTDLVLWFLLEAKTELFFLTPVILIAIDYICG